MKVLWVTRLSPGVKRHVAYLLDLSVFDQGILGFDDPGDKTAIDSYLKSLDGKLQSGNSWLLYASEDGVPVFMILMERLPHPTSHHLAELKKAIINPVHRGQGLIRLGAAEISKKAREQGIDTLLIDVRSGTRAAKLWQVLGFKVYGRLEDYARYRGHSYAGLYMSSTVDNLERGVQSPGLSH